MCQEDVYIQLPNCRWLSKPNDAIEEYYEWVQLSDGKWEAKFTYPDK